MNDMEIWKSEITEPEPFTQGSMEALKRQLSMGSYPGYPPQRLVMLAWHLDCTDPDTRLNLPTGPWEINSDNLPSEAEQQRFVDEGLGLDTQGRPVHPWIEHMLFDRNLGVVTGKGAYWNWGPNYTADPIVMRQTQEGTEVLLIERGDTGMLALPGGFIDIGEKSLDAAIREAHEETGIDVSRVAASAQPIYNGPLADLRVTANAWPHTSAWKFDVSEIDTPDPVGQDDAKSAGWVNVNKVGEVLFGSHKLLIMKALETT